MYQVEIITVEDRGDEVEPRFMCRLLDSSEFHFSSAAEAWADKRATELQAENPTIDVDYDIYNVD